MEYKQILTLESGSVRIPIVTPMQSTTSRMEGLQLHSGEQLGHRTIETVEKYLYWSTDDKLEEFQKYSPLDNMEF